jgi:hypothetical protein
MNIKVYGDISCFSVTLSKLLLGVMNEHQESCEDCWVEAHTLKEYEHGGCTTKEQ